MQTMQEPYELCGLTAGGCVSEIQGNMLRAPTQEKDERKRNTSAVDCQFETNPKALKSRIWELVNCL